METGNSLPHSQGPTTWPYPEPDQSSPFPYLSCSICILVLSSHTCLRLSSGLFPLGFLNKTVHAPLLSPIRSICLAHPILCDLSPVIFGEGCRWCLLYHSERVGRLSSRCLGPYFDPDFGNTKYVRSAGRPAYQPKHKALHFRREAIANSVLCISFGWRSVHVRCTDIDTSLNEARIS